MKIKYILLIATFLFSLNIHAEDEFPLANNSQVMKQLNIYSATAAGRYHMRVCLKRMETYQPMISKKIKTHGLPMELMAIPIVESCYRNIKSKEGTGAGLWMFVKTTARGHGLKVTKKVDQRLNTKLETEAALTYLAANYKRFDDWELALLAYNMGENKVKRAIKKTGSRDAWVLVRKGHEGDKGYLAKVLAVAIIMKNPGLLGKQKTDGRLAARRPRHSKLGT